MSGPKCSQYEVRANLERERRRRAEAMQQIRELKNAVSSLNVRVRNLGAGSGISKLTLSGTPSDTDDLATIESWLADAKGQIRETGTRIGAVVQARHAAELVRKLDGESSEAAVRFVARPESKTKSVHPKPAVSIPAPAAAALVLQQVTDIVAATPAEATGEEKQLIDRAAELACHAPADQARSYLVSLQSVATSVRKAVEHRRKRAEQATVLLATIAGLPGPGIEWARTLLRRVEDGQADFAPGDVEKIEEMARQATVEDDRVYVASVLESTLADLGYRVGENFATAVLSSTPEYVASSELPDHAVEFIVTGKKIETRVVRTSGLSNAQEDTAAEEAFCRSFAALTAETHRRGVTMSLVSYEAPGSVPVRRVVQQTGQRRRANKQQLRERTANQ